VVSTGIDYGECGLVKLDWSYLSRTALYRKDVDAAGESLQGRRSANMVSSNKDVDVLWVVTEVM
jgi:hypothetical protein